MSKLPPGLLAAFLKKKHGSKGKSGKPAAPGMIPGSKAASAMSAGKKKSSKSVKGGY